MRACNGIDMAFPSKIRWTRKTKLSERRLNSQFMAVHENGEILVMFTWYDNLCCLFFIDLSKVVTTPLLYICQAIGEKWGWSVTIQWNIKIGKVLWIGWKRWTLVSIISKGENAERCRGKQAIYNEDEQNRRDNRALMYTWVDRMRIREVAIDPNYNWPIR